MAPQKRGTSAKAWALGARNRSIGATKSFSSAVKDEDARVLTTRRLKGVPQTSPPNVVTGSSPNFVRFTENSINWLATYLPFRVDAGAGLLNERLYPAILAQRDHSRYY